MASILNKLKDTAVDGFANFSIESIKPKSAVFGAAPSLQAMKDLNELTKGKKTLFRGASFWFYFRFYYFQAAPVIFLVFMVVALTAWNTAEGHLVLGSIMSLVSSVAVVASYIMIVPWRKHPSILVVYRSLTSAFFSVNIILNAVSQAEKRNTACTHFSVTTNGLLLTGEMWLTTIAVDLVYSLTNPFSSYKGNLQKYHIAIWVVSLILSFALWVNPSCQGTFEGGVCWLRADGGGKAPCIWGYYLFWVICMYAYQIYASIFAWNRLQKGLEITFEIRKKCAEETFKCLSAYAVYIVVLIFFFGIFSSNPTSKPGSSMSNFGNFLLFCIANRGTVDGTVWFMLHSFVMPSKSEEENLGEKDEESTPRKEYLALDASDDLFDDEKTNGNSGLVNPIKDVKKTLLELADLAISEFDEADMSPQMNIALRQQIVKYVTTGVRDSILKEAEIVRQNNPTTKMSESAQPKNADRLKTIEFTQDEQFPFASFAPEIFREIRRREGVSDEFYVNSLGKTANEKLSEGASGAFMFFCGKGEFIVKTIKVREARVLHTSLRQYFDYLIKNEGSFLCKFYGSYSLSMFSQTFYFVVMKNIFEVGQTINERYDIKGSWVGRSADPEPPTKKTVCRHCNELFVPMKKEKCTVVVGYHEGNVVLKDNDLRAKITLVPEIGKRVLKQLKKDSDLLGQLGVLDYSLLIGVKKYKFGLNLTDEDVGVDTTKANYIYKGSAISGPGVYFFGIVDFLQDWNMKKAAERMFKIYIKRKSPTGLSVMQPENYMKRFQKKMEELFDVDDEAQGIAAAVSLGSKSSGGSSDVSVLGNKTDLLSMSKQVVPVTSENVTSNALIASERTDFLSKAEQAFDSTDSWEKVDDDGNPFEKKSQPRTPMATSGENEF